MSACRSSLNRSMTSWNAAEVAAEGLRIRTAGANLYRHLVTLYAERKMSAKDLSIACYFCSEAGVRGADFQQMALAPGQSSGNYQKAIDRVLPPFSPLYWLPTPVTMRGTVHRQVRPMPHNPLHEAIAREVRQDPSILQRVSTMQWPPCYMEHPLVREAQAQGKVWPLPLALYLDGVRFTSPLAGRADSILGVWAYNGVTSRRHYLFSLRAQDTCQCGCKGWCSLFPLMACLAWSVRCLLLGKRPTTRHDGSNWSPEDPVGQATLQFGEDLPHAIVLYLKGDWSEVHHSLGLPSVNSANCPCPLCASTQEGLHTKYRSLDFPSKPRCYEESCGLRELRLRVTTEAERCALMGALHFPRGRARCGRELRSDLAIGGVQLQAKDRVEPTIAMPDIMLLDSAPLPMDLVFWRTRRDLRQRLSDPVVHRNPLFSADLLDPSAVIAVDSLHTVYLGVVNRLVSAMLWRVLLSNAWQTLGGQERVLEQGIRRMAAHLAVWFEQNRVPHDRRVSTMSLALLGDRLACAVGGEPHPGGVLKLKAAECGTLLPWAIDLVVEKGQAVAFRQELLSAARALQTWLETTRENGPVLAPGVAQVLRDSAQRCLLNCMRAKVKFVPKHHFFAHLSLSAASIGNPKVYSCFVDESLNFVLRTIAESSHRARQEERIFTFFHLLGRLGWSDHLYGD